ncbi:MAG: hypothetical protein QOF85_1997 [Solirubrobacterales bacterium]|nr:hypothetical protein [Solirubrobacterales bacterium]
MVGEAESQAVLGQLTPLGWPGARRFDEVEIADEQVVDCTGVGGTDEAEALPQGLEGVEVITWPQVEVAAEEQWRVPSPLDRRSGRPQNVGRGEVGPVVGRVQVGDADARGGASEGHRPPLRPAPVDRQLPPLHDPPVPVRFMPTLGA